MRQMCEREPPSSRIKEGKRTQTHGGEEETWPRQLSRWDFFSQSQLRQPMDAVPRLRPFSSSSSTFSPLDIQTGPFKVTSRQILVLSSETAASFAANQGEMSFLSTPAGMIVLGTTRPKGETATLVLLTLLFFLHYFKSR